ncbi:MAG: hypothetical protein K6B14_07860 [Lachnospiraceae bacterium]|nr:hypothetical protein [Lachnospiraceae bacterium]
MKDLNKEVNINQVYQPVESNIEEEDFININMNINQEIELRNQQSNQNPGNSAYGYGASQSMLSKELKEKLLQKGMYKNEINALPKWDDTQAMAYGSYEIIEKPSQEEIDAYIRSKAKGKVLTENSIKRLTDHFIKDKYRQFHFTNRVNKYLQTKNSIPAVKKFNFEGMTNREMNEEQEEYGHCV